MTATSTICWALVMLYCLTLSAKSRSRLDDLLPAGLHFLGGVAGVDDQLGVLARSLVVVAVWSVLMSTAS